MKWVNNKKGMTLVEIIIAVAILGIIVIAFSSAFTGGYVGIIRSGNQAKAAYSSQEEMITKIQAKDSSGTQNLNINFSGVSPISIVVEIIESEEEINGSVSTMASFIPTP